MIRNYFFNLSKKYASKWLVFFIDLFVVLFTLFSAYLIRFNFTLNFDVKQFFVQLPFLALVAATSFLIVGSYKSVIRHTGFTDVVNVFKAVVLIAVIGAAGIFINRATSLMPNFTIPLSIIVIHSLLSFVTLTGSRLLFKIGYNHLKCKFKTSRNILIYGAGDSGIITYNALLNGTNKNFNIINFIDDDIKKRGKLINGISILKGSDIDEKFILDNGIDEIIVASQTIEPKRIIKLVDSLIDLDVKVKKVPPIESWIDGEFSANQIKQVQIEDLLGRPPNRN